MFKKYKIIIWILGSLAVVVLAIILLGVYIISLLPSENVKLSHTKPTDIEYITANASSNRGKILAVVTNTELMGSSGKRTGYELTELARAYYVFKANGFEVDIASPSGGEPPVVLDEDDMGVFDYAFLNDDIAQKKLKNTLSLKDVNSEPYKAVYFVGGKGAMFDFPDNEHIQKLVQDFNKSDKVIGAVCHGPVALINIKLEDGSSYLKNKQVSGFTNKEELLLIPEAKTIFPFLLQDKLIEDGAIFNEGEMYLEKISWDDNLITGQNPWSVWALAEAMVEQIGYQPKQRTLTAEENAVKVLYAYETEGLEKSKAVVKSMAQVAEKPISRELLLSHSAISVIQGDLVKFYQILSLASYSKDLEKN